MKMIWQILVLATVAVTSGCTTLHRPPPQPVRIDIQISPDRTLEMNGSRFAVTDLQSRMKALHITEPKTMPVFITQPKGMPRETMHRVFDELALAGFWTLKGIEKQERSTSNCSVRLRRPKFAALDATR